MKIAVPKEIAAGERRVALVPDVVRKLTGNGHEVVVQVSEDLRPAVEAAGHRFLSEIPNAQTSPGYYFENYPERMQKSPGMDMTGYDLVHFFARNIAAQSASLKITPEILGFIAELDEFKGAWRALGTLAPERPAEIRIRPMIK